MNLSGSRLVDRALATPDCVIAEDEPGPRTESERQSAQLGDVRFGSIVLQTSRARMAPLAFQVIQELCRARQRKSGLSCKAWIDPDRTPRPASAGRWKVAKSFIVHWCACHMTGA